MRFRRHHALALLLLAPLAALAADSRPPAEVDAISTDLRADFIPEGLVWDAERGRFLLGSVHLRRVVSIDPATGASRPFAGGMDSLLGMHLSPDGQRLWAAGTSLPQGDAPVTPGRTGLWVMDAASGRVLGRHGVPIRDETGNLGDFTFLGEHTLVASDSGTGALWRYHLDESRWSPLLPAGSFRSPQGLAPGRQADSVYLADYSTGIWRIGLDGSHTALAPPEGAELRGIDGLYRDGDRLVAIQNGTRVHRILLLRLAADAERIEAVDVLAQAGEHWIEPTLGTIVGEDFWFVANSQWNRFDADGRLPPVEQLVAPRIERLRLPPR